MSRSEEVVFSVSESTAVGKQWNVVLGYLSLFSRDMLNRAVVVLLSLFATNRQRTKQPGVATRI